MSARSGKYVRPLLDCSKSEILKYATGEQINYVEDETNSDTVFLRNNIRHNVIPLMQTLNPQAIEHIADTMQTIGSIEKILDRWFNDLLAKVIVDTDTPAASSCRQIRQNSVIKDYSQTLSIRLLKKIKQLDVFLELLLQSKDFPRSIISQITESITGGTAGKIFYSPTHTLRRERSTVIIEKTSLCAAPAAAQDNNFADTPPMLNYDKQFFANINEVPKDSTIAVLAIDKIKEPLILRKWKEGDFFYPLGMNKKQKLSDFFNNNKFSSTQKRYTWVLTHRGDIVWIVGYRIDDRYKLKFPRGAGTEAVVVTLGHLLNGFSEQEY